MSQTQLKTIDAYTRLQQNLAFYHVVRVAVNCGVLKALEAGQKTSAELAKVLNLDPWRTELLCSALVHGFGGTIRRRFCTVIDGTDDAARPIAGRTLAYSGIGDG
ncbi:MAG: hypothetical protein R3C03_17275 [Pirellulaceae bacterium]